MKKWRAVSKSYLFKKTWHEKKYTIGTQNCRVFSPFFPIVRICYVHHRLEITRFSTVISDIFALQWDTNVRMDGWKQLSPPSTEWSRGAAQKQRRLGPLTFLTVGFNSSFCWDNVRGCKELSKQTYNFAGVFISLLEAIMGMKWFWR